MSEAFCPPHVLIDGLIISFFIKGAIHLGLKNTLFLNIGHSSSSKSEF
jgi:hypothetical protein